MRQGPWIYVRRQAWEFYLWDRVSDPIVAAEHLDDTEIKLRQNVAGVLRHALGKLRLRCPQAFQFRGLLVSAQPLHSFHEQTKTRRVGKLEVSLYATRFQDACKFRGQRIYSCPIIQ